MKKAKSTIIALAVVLLMVQTAGAFTDLCRQAEKCLNMTTSQMDEFYKDELATWRVSGSGKVYDVVTDSRNRGTIIINCGNDVYACVSAGKMWGSIKDLHVGQPISFTGDCKGLKRQYFRDSDQAYIKAIVVDANFEY